MKNIMYTTRSNHQTRINGPSNDSTQRIPSPFIEPIKKIIKPMFDHVGRGSVIEPGKSSGQLRFFIQKLKEITSTCHGSNSWIILSNLMTAKRRDEKPAIHANSNTTKIIRLLMPALLFSFVTVDFLVPA